MLRSSSRERMEHNLGISRNFPSDGSERKSLSPVRHITLLVLLFQIGHINAPGRLQVYVVSATGDN